MKKTPKTMIQVTGGGSGTGISALINGTTDICEASRPMKDAEKKQLAERSGAPPIETPVARDGLSVYVNDANPIDELTMAQLKAIFTGKVKSWKELGGRDATIIPYSRENSSGTYVSGGGGFSIGFLSVGGTASHSSTTDTSEASGSSGTRASDSYGWRFQNDTLEIHGTQIIAFLSEIVPPCAPLDDPSL